MLSLFYDFINHLTMVMHAAPVTLTLLTALMRLRYLLLLLLDSGIQATKKA